MAVLIFYVLVLNLLLCFHIFSYVRVTEWPSFWKIAAYLAYNMFLHYKYLIVNLVFPTSVFEW